MEQSIGMAEAKSRLAELVGQAAYGGQRYILQRRGRPMAVLVGIDEYRRLQELVAEQGSPALPPHLLRRQEQLVAQAQRLRARLGDPLDGLADLLSALPPPDDEFWFQLADEAA